MAMATVFLGTRPIVLALLCAVTSLAAVVLYRLFFAPLSKFPGPKITAVTQLWMMYHEFKGDRTVVIDQLHSRYGPVVRVSPDEVSFNNYEGLREIYGIKSTFSKSSFYDLFVYYNTRNTFTSLDKPNHSAKKRLVADRYTKSYVMQPSVADKVREHASAFMKQVTVQGPVLDVYTWLHYYALDAITNHLYGIHGTKTLSNPEHRGIVYDLSGVKHRTRLYMLHYFGWLMSLKSQMTSVMRKLSGQNTAFHVRGNRLNDYGESSVSAFRRDQATKDTLSTCAKLFREVPNNEPAIAAECMDHLVAGVDTTGDAMCILMWRISTPEYTHVQDTLFRELSTIKDSFDPVTRTAPIAVLDKLPYLDAVIHEAMRWRPPVPMTLFRVVPPTGAVISGHAVPAGTTVGCQSYSLHRVEEVFPNPDLFDPTRWLTEDAAHLTAMRNHFWPFSSGGRMCLGHNLAMVEMKLIVAAVYMHYTTRATPGVTEESMRMDDQLTSGVPYALSCPLEFVAR
ncbi:hypothetical protein LTR99_005777 [Exophiala xenobiotica]|uniref:Cytochrome P450 n=1 Tax=Vermiconidia calcicola TaxID=1690605 RepID=A0AAV9QI36_9PEZI|nr:hypothetical protein H2202_000349 [Exophiala xenobiotica]KAK5541149.1 hypothetical protein LTR25_002926 [Vermiconidia calcicola]KAK5549358.1 hypothetical protein LTR23_000466 [Chaetothyriales sp. CCFEE 6169]KAK5193993.1 hypothetical protein LTR92_006333 [Exophiala xenobiotica]KAK5222768.1 hypothetical protein LTR72_005605 [Exophiala xenobiotica]